MRRSPPLGLPTRQFTKVASHADSPGGAGAHERPPARALGVYRRSGPATCAGRRRRSASTGPDVFAPGAQVGASMPALTGPDRQFLTFPSRSMVRTMPDHEHGEQQFGPAAQAAEWDARYRERDGAMWSGRPNGRLVDEVADLTPGRALDVGCGEGADAIWLAQHGWTVTAIDISEVAVGRARAAADRAGATVEWISGDALQTPFRPARSTSCRCSTRRCPRPPARPPCGRCSTRCARAGCCSPSTTTSTTSTAST